MFGRTLQTEFGALCSNFYLALRMSIFGDFYFLCFDFFGFSLILKGVQYRTGFWGDFLGGKCGREKNKRLSWLPQLYLTDAVKLWSGELWMVVWFYQTIFPLLVHSRSEHC